MERWRCISVHHGASSLGAPHLSVSCPGGQEDKWLPGLYQEAQSAGPGRWLCPVPSFDGAMLLVLCSVWRRGGSGRLHRSLQLPERRLQQSRGWPLLPVNNGMGGDGLTLCWGGRLRLDLNIYSQKEQRGTGAAAHGDGRVTIPGGKEK